MPAVVPLASVAVGAYSASRQASAANRGADAQAQAAAAATEEQRRQYDLTRADQRPFLDAGYDALDRQQSILDGDYSGFMNSPDYVYARDEMQRGVERGAAARGGLYNGGTSVDLARHLGGLASQNLGNYWNRLAGRAGQGQTTAQGLGALGANMASNIGAYGLNAANARASSYMTGANAMAQGAFGALGAFNNWYGNNSAANGGGTGWYLGRQPGPG